MLAETDCVDIVVRGQGECSMQELIRCFLDGGELTDVAGIAIKENGDPSLTAARPLEPYENLPAADYLSSRSSAILLSRTDANSTT